eukprot:COSAG05_NODE_94_length_19565_cov_15.870133_11_plen_365_part_00
MVLHEDKTLDTGLSSPPVLQPDSPLEDLDRTMGLPLCAAEMPQTHEHDSNTDGERGGQRKPPSTSVESGVATTPDRQEAVNSGGVMEAETSPAVSAPQQPRATMCDAAVQVVASDCPPSAVDAARGLEVAVRYTQSCVQGKGNSKLTAAIRVLNAFVAQARSAPVATVTKKRRAHRRAGTTIESANSGQPGAAAATQRLSSGQKRMLRVVPTNFVVSDGISVQNSTAAELATPRYCISAPLQSDDGATHSDEDCSDAAFEAMHRPSERKERTANKQVIISNYSRRMRSPLLRGSPHGARRPAVSSLQLAAKSPKVAVEPADWEVVAGGAKNCIRLRKIRKRSVVEDVNSLKRRAEIFNAASKAD